MFLLEFRKCSKVLNFCSDKISIKEFNRKDMKTHGFYHEGLNSEILGIFAQGKELCLIRGKQIFYNLANRIILNCQKTVLNNTWRIIARFDYDEDFFLDFTYKSYLYYPPDDDSEADVNFGLFLKELFNNEEKRDRFIIANS